MKHNQLLINGPKIKTNWFQLITGYLILTFTYHVAEYAMRFHQHIPLFLGFMFAVVPVAFLVAKWQGFKGLSAWGLQTNRRTLIWLALGLVLGFLINVLAFLVRIWLNIEVVSATPSLQAMVMTTLIFALGTFLPSLAEDILTRGYLYKHLENRISKLGFILVSSTIYVLNHIYVLGNGPAQLIYLFVIGLMLAIPLVNTDNLWYTVGAHWAGNIVYRFTSDVIKVERGSNDFPSLWELTLFILLFVFINQIITKVIRQNIRGKLN